MLVLGIILVCIAMVGMFYFIFAEDKDEIGMGFLLGLVFVCGVMLIVSTASEGNPIKHSIKSHTLSVEIKIEQKDGVEISRDTIYVFTPIIKK